MSLSVRARNGFDFHVGWDDGILASVVAHSRLWRADKVLLSNDKVGEID